MPLWLAPAITGAAGLGQSLLTEMNNKRSQNFTREMYDLQRTHALADWNMLNEYNTPEAQMKRFKDAGLNPNLIYGQGNMSQPVRGASSGSWNPQTPNIQGAAQSAVGTYFDAQIKEQNINNLKQSYAVMKADEKLKEANALNATNNAAWTASKNARTNFDYELAQKLKDTVIWQAQAKADMAGYNRDILYNTADDIIDLREGSLQKQLYEILNLKANIGRTSADTDRIKQQIDNMQKTGQLQQLEIDLRRLGINPNGKLWETVLGRIINGLGLF